MEPSGDARLVIEFNGTAVWIDADGEWQSEDDALARRTADWWNNSNHPSLGPAYYPNLDAAIAKAAKEELGADIVRIQPIDYDDEPDGAVY